MKETISTNNIAELNTITYHDGDGNADNIGVAGTSNPMVAEASDFARVITDPINEHVRYQQW